MAHKIAFLGRDERMTRFHFREFAEANRDQVRLCEFKYGIIALKDGTEIYRAKLAPDWTEGRRFDQVIVAGTLDNENATATLEALLYSCRHSDSPEEYRVQWYDPDAYMSADPCDECNRWAECNGVDRECCPVYQHWEEKQRRELAAQLDLEDKTESGLFEED